MSRRLVNMRLPDGLVTAVDEARGDVSRTRFVERALEKALEGVGSDQPRSGKTAEVPATAAPLPASPAPSQASTSSSLRNFST